MAVHLSSSPVRETEPAWALEAPAIFRQGLVAAERNIGREGLEPGDGTGSVYRATAEGATMAVAIAGAENTVRQAVHHGAVGSLARTVFDVFCRTIESMPVQEAAEHGAIYALHRIKDPNMSGPVKGILLPGNGIPTLALPIRLIRAIAANYSRANGIKFDWNFHDRPFSPRWQALSLTDKLSEVSGLVSRFRDAQGLGERDIEILGIDKHDRLVVIFSDQVPIARKPGLMMDLERDIRRRTGERVELFLEVVKDRNQLRRL